MTKIKREKEQDCKDVESHYNSNTSLVEVLIGTAIWKTASQYTLKLNIPISYDSAIPLPESCPNVHQKTYKRIFVVLLFIKAPGWKQSTCWIKIELTNKLQNGCRVKYYRAMKISDITTWNMWMNLKNINFSKRSHRQKIPYSLTPFI